jgi:Predicted transcriptional regulator
MLPLLPFSEALTVVFPQGVAAEDMSKVSFFCEVWQRLASCEQTQARVTRTRRKARAAPPVTEPVPETQTQTPEPEPVTTTPSQPVPAGYSEVLPGTVAQIAKRLGKSVRTVARDLKQLQKSGVGIVAAPYANGNSHKRGRRQMVYALESADATA